MKDFYGIRVNESLTPYQALDLVHEAEEKLFSAASQFTRAKMFTSYERDNLRRAVLEFFAAKIQLAEACNREAAAKATSERQA